MVSNFLIVTRIQTRSVQALETTANSPSRKTPPDIGEQPAGEPRICSAPHTRSTVGGSDSFTLWWSQTETEGFRYQQIKLHLSQSKVTLSAWDLDRLRSVFPLNSECSSLASRTLFGHQYTFCHHFWVGEPYLLHLETPLARWVIFSRGSLNQSKSLFRPRAALTGVLSGTVSPEWTTENATVFTPPANVCSSEMSG